MTDRCPCGSPSSGQCHHCERPLCVAHYAAQPVSVSGTEVQTQSATKLKFRPGRIELVPVCFPVCSADWWRKLEKAGAA